MERLSERSFTAMTDSIAPARRFVRQGAEAVAVDPNWLADVELAASELISNAIEHGTGHEFAVGVGVDGEHFVLRVCSSHSGPGLADPSEWKAPPPEVLTGRGLSLVKAVSSSAWVEHVDGIITIGCRFNGR